MATAVYKVKRLFNNLASIRTTTIDLCVKKKADLRIEYDNRSMTVSLEKLSSPDKFQIHKRIFASKFNPGQKYVLYDFPFIPDGYTEGIGEQKNNQELLDELYSDLKTAYDKAMNGFVPEFGNKFHIQLIGDIKGIKESLEKFKFYKPTFSRAKLVAADIERKIKGIEFLRNGAI